MIQLLKDTILAAWARAYAAAPDKDRAALYFAIREHIPSNALSRIERILLEGYDPIRVYEQASRELPKPLFRGGATELNALGVQEILGAFHLATIVDEFVKSLDRAETEGALINLKGLKAIAASFVDKLSDLAHSFPAHTRQAIAARVKAAYAEGSTVETVAEAAIKQRAEAIREEERLRIYNAMTAPNGYGIEDSHCVHCAAPSCDGAISKGRIRALIYETPKP